MKATGAAGNPNKTKESCEKKRGDPQISGLGFGGLFYSVSVVL